MTHGLHRMMFLFRQPHTASFTNKIILNIQDYSQSILKGYRLYLIAKNLKCYT